MKKVLVVVDMQNDFIDEALGTKEAVAILPNVCRLIRTFHSEKGNDCEIFVTKDTHGPDYMETQEGRNLPVEHCIKGTHGWMLNADVEDALKDKTYRVFEKNTFGSKELAQAIKDMDEKDGIEDLTFLGLCTGICVISNAMLAKAFVPELPIVIEASCCACVTPESHKTALEAMKLCQMQVME